MSSYKKPAIERLIRLRLRLDAGLFRRFAAWAAEVGSSRQALGVAILKKATADYRRQQRKARGR